MPERNAEWEHREEPEEPREERAAYRTPPDEEAPEPERPITPLEEQGMDIEELDEPPQAEGPRDIP